MEEETLTNELNAPHLITLPMKKIQINEAKNVIKRKSHPKKAPGYDLITRNVPQDLSQKGLWAITQIYTHHTTKQILSLSVESRTNINDRKTEKKLRRHSII